LIFYLIILSYGNLNQQGIIVLSSSIFFLQLGIQHLYTIQEIARLKDIIHHTYKATTTGDLYRTSLELLFLEVGMGTNLADIGFDSTSYLATDSLVKSTWQFLNDNNLQLHHNVSISFQRLEDKVLMSEFLLAGASKEKLLSLNWCRLYLKAYFLSDITNGYGTRITDDIWMGRYRSLSWHSSWPKQAPPLRHDWTIWRNFTKHCFVSRGLKLQQPLGAWIQHDATWPWYY
jgi:hypothetical protein